MINLIFAIMRKLELNEQAIALARHIMAKNRTESSTYAKAISYYLSGDTGFTRCEYCNLPVLSATDENHEACPSQEDYSWSLERDDEELYGIATNDCPEQEYPYGIGGDNPEEGMMSDEDFAQYLAAQQAADRAEEDAYYDEHYPEDKDDSEECPDGCGQPAGISCTCAELESLRKHNANPDTRGSYWVA